MPIRTRGSRTLSSGSTTAKSGASGPGRAKVTSQNLAGWILNAMSFNYSLSFARDLNVLGWTRCRSRRSLGVWARSVRRRLIRGASQELLLRFTGSSPRPRDSPDQTAMASPRQTAKENCLPSCGSNVSTLERQNHMNTTPILQGKHAAVFGAGGSIGTAVAKEFAAEGAEVFLSGRTKPGVDAMAKQIAAKGGLAHAAAIDTLDDAAVW